MRRAVRRGTGRTQSVPAMGAGSSCCRLCHEAPAGGGRRLRRVQGLFQVCAQVVDMLDAHGQAQHAFGHAGLGQFFGIELAVRGGRRVRGQRLGVADVDQRVNSCRASRKRAPAARFASGQLQAEGQNAEARPCMYFSPARGPGGLPARVIDPGDLRVVLQVLAIAACCRRCGPCAGPGSRCPAGSGRRSRAMAAPMLRSGTTRAADEGGGAERFGRPRRGRTRPARSGA
jgi:hypothetical protein